MAASLNKSEWRAGGLTPSRVGREHSGRVSTTPLPLSIHPNLDHQGCRVLLSHTSWRDLFFVSFQGDCFHSFEKLCCINEQHTTENERPGVIVSCSPCAVVSALDIIQPQRLPTVCGLTIGVSVGEVGGATKTSLVSRRSAGFSIQHRRHVTVDVLEFQVIHLVHVSAGSTPLSKEMWS